MPIQINLLAEAQALEEQRRRDPVKRVVLVGVILVTLILVWSSSLMVKTMMTKGDVNRLEADLNSRTNQYRQILENQKMLEEGYEKVAALNKLATNRFLVGNLLNALQQTTFDNVQLVQLKIDQTYIVTEAKTNQSRTASKSAVVAKPATATEKVLLTLNVKDTSSPPGDSVNKFQGSLSGAPYFQEALGSASGFRLANLGTPQSDPDGKVFVLFTLEAHFPDKTR